MLNDIRADWTRRSVSVAAMGAMVGAPSVGLANTITVSNMHQLGAAFGQARGGETILIAPGDYGMLFLRGRSFPSRVTLRAQDPQRPPRFAMIRVLQCANVELVSLDCGGQAKPVNQSWLGFVDVRTSQRISMRNLRVTGLLDQPGGFSRDLGVFIRDCSEIVLQNSFISRLHQGLTLFHVQGVDVSGNKFEQICMDAMRCVGTSNGVIANNSVTKFIAHPTDHCDGLQIFTGTGIIPCSNIIIRNNTFIYGPGLGLVQGIFIRSETREPHKNISIENNLVYSEVWHGITLSNTIGGIIRNNTAIAPPGLTDRRSGPARGAWILVGQDAQDILVERNIANAFTFGPGVQRIQHRDNIQARLLSTPVPPTLLTGVTDGTYRDLYGTESLGWAPPASALIARSAVLTASTSSAQRVGFQG